MIVSFRSSRLLPEQVDQAITMRHRINAEASTSFFIAPEFDNSSRYDEKIDVFAFAAIIFELATGKAPFAEFDGKQILEKLKNGKRPEFPKGFDNDDLADLIRHCWEQDSKDRYTFDQVMKDMVQKKIVFNQDKGREGDIEQFYQNSISNVDKIDTCRSLIENIKKDIMNTCQYRHILFRTRSLLNHYQSFLLHEYDSKNLNDNDAENDKIDELIFYLQQFSSVITRVLPDNWNRMAPTLEVNKTIDETRNYMTEIKRSIQELGFQGDDEYQESKEDLIFDIRELYMAFEKFEDQSVSRNKRKEITSYLRKIDPNYLKEIKNPSKQQRHDKIVNLFSNFNRYECKSDDFVKNFKVQQGKNSTVYEGYNSLNGKPVAIKVFNGNELGKSEKNLFNLRREIEYLTRVNHKYIAKFVGYAIDPNNNDVLLVTELAKSGTMKEMLSEKIKHLTGIEKTNIAFKLIEAMEYLNSQQIIHRGLTTSNIVIEGDMPKLIDFGNASADIKGVDLDPYDNPTLSDVEYDTKDDIFACSMILYEMLTGEIPQGPNYGFNIQEEEKSDLQKLIELGFQQTNQDLRTFNKIKNTMITNRIAYPNTTEEETFNFYNKKEDK